jgi:hypothetical protein
MTYKLALSTLTVLALCSCAQVLGIEDTSYDSTQQPVEKTGPWRCVTGKTPTPPAVIPATIKLTMTAIDYEAQAPTSGVSFVACPNRNDIACSAPAGSGVTDSSGSATFDVATNPTLGFVGFIKITGTRTIGSGGGDYVTFHYFFSNPLYADQVIPPSIVATQANVDRLAQQAGAEDRFTVPDGAPEGTAPNAGLAHISATSLDCDFKAAAGVTFEITQNNSPPKGAVTWYFSNGAASNGASSTDAVGLGGALFLTASDVGLSYRVSARNSDKTVVSDGDLLLSRNAFSTILMLPR